MVKSIYDFHAIREACLAGDPEGWQRSIRSYAPLARYLLEQYFPQLDRGPLLQEVFARAKAADSTFWQDFAGSSEKEFLLHLREWVIGVGRQRRGASAETPLTTENFWGMLQQFPLLQRELLLLAFRGYQPERLGEMIKFTPATVRETARQAREKLAGILPGAGEDDFLAGDHDALFETIEKGRGENCLPDRAHVRIGEGQVTWRERETAERHLDGCLYCLDRSAVYREVHHTFRVLPPLAESLAGELRTALGLPVTGEPAKKKSFWQRLRGR